MHPVLDGRRSRRPRLSVSTNVSARHRAVPHLRRRVVITAAFVGSLAAACSIGEVTHETITLPFRASTETKTCDSKFVLPPVATLKPCGEGKGHCFDGTRVNAPGLPACEGKDVCVPDEILNANGTKLKSCKFFIGGAPGVCVSLLHDQVAAHKDQLQKDVCEADERCAPCVDPTNGKETKICEATGVHELPCTGGKEANTAVACCHGSGTCINAEAVPEDQRGDLSREVCPAAQLCAPAAMVGGAPVKCSAAGLSGVCLDVCFASMMKSVSKAMRGGCGPTELCMPCLLAAGQGMPGCD